PAALGQGERRSTEHAVAAGSVAPRRRAASIAAVRAIDSASAHRSGYRHRVKLRRAAIWGHLSPICLRSFNTINMLSLALPLLPSLAMRTVMVLMALLGSDAIAAAPGSLEHIRAVRARGQQKVEARRGAETVKHGLLYDMRQGMV